MFPLQQGGAILGFVCILNKSHPDFLSKMRKDAKHVGPLTFIGKVMNFGVIHYTRVNKCFHHKDLTGNKRMHYADFKSINFKDVKINQ
jgi:hypothetical protein